MPLNQFSLPFPKVCFAVLLLGLMQPGCSNTADVEEAKSKFEVAEEPGIANSSPVDPEFPWRSNEKGEAAITRMLAYAQMLHTRTSQVDLQQRLQDRITLTKIADELLLEDLDETQKAIAFQIKSKALLELHQANQPDALGRVKEMIETFKQDPSPALAKSAGLLEVTIAMSDYFRDETSIDKPMRDAFKSMAKRHINDPEVAHRLTMLTAQLVSKGRRMHAVKVMRDLRNVYLESTNETLKPLPPRLQDRIHLIESGFDITLNDMLKSKDPSKFIDAVKKLAAREDAGPEIYNEVIAGARILEQFGMYDKATQINNVIKNSFSAHSDPKIAEKCARDTLMGERRMGLTGRPFQIVGVDKDGKAFDPQVIANKIVIVYLWSAKFPASVKAMQGLLPLYDRVKEQGVEIVSLSIDDDVEKAISVFGDQHPPWINLFHSNEAYQQMLDNAGIQMVPYTILIKRDGNVDRIRVPLPQLEREIVRLESESVESK